MSIPFLKKNENILLKRLKTPLKRGLRLAVVILERIFRSIASGGVGSDGAHFQNRLHWSFFCITVRPFNV
jgi:hypothetical protein